MNERKSSGGKKRREPATVREEGEKVQWRESREEKRKKNHRRWRERRRKTRWRTRRCGDGGTGRRGVVLTRTGAFLIIICLSLGISREERERPRGASDDGGVRGGTEEETR